MAIAKQEIRAESVLLLLLFCFVFLKAKVNGGKQKERAVTAC